MELQQQADYELKPRFTIVEKPWYELFTEDGILLNFGDAEKDEQGQYLVAVDKYGLNIISLPAEDILGYIPDSPNGPIKTINYGVISLGVASATAESTQFVFALVLLANDVPPETPLHIAIPLNNDIKVGALLENGEPVKDPRQMMSGYEYSFEIPSLTEDGMDTGQEPTRLAYVFGTAHTSRIYPQSFNTATVTVSILELVVYNKLLNALQYHYTEPFNGLGDEHVHEVLSYIPETFNGDDALFWLQTNYITKMVEIDVLTYDPEEHAKVKNGILGQDAMEDADLLADEDFNHSVYGDDTSD